MDNKTEIPGITKEMVPDMVAGARLSKEQDDVEAWLEEVFNGDPNKPSDNPAVERVNKTFKGFDEASRAE